MYNIESELGHDWTWSHQLLTLYQARVLLSAFYNILLLTTNLIQNIVRYACWQLKCAHESWEKKSENPAKKLFPRAPHYTQLKVYCVQKLGTDACVHFT